MSEVLCGAWLSRTPATWFVGEGGGEKGLDRVRLHLDPTECPQAFIPGIDWLANWTPASRVRGMRCRTRRTRSKCILIARSAQRRMHTKKKKKKKKINTRVRQSTLSEYRFLRNLQMSHPPLISRFANDTIVSRCNGLVVRYTDGGGHFRFVNRVIRSSCQWLRVNGLHGASVERAICLVAYRKGRNQSKLGNECALCHKSC